MKIRPAAQVVEEATDDAGIEQSETCGEGKQAVTQRRKAEAEYRQRVERTLQSKSCAINR